jgi:lipopolysaccharide transport system ATP-binding protein
MKEVAISLRNISKKFRLFNSPNDRFFEAFHPFNKKYHKEFWALKDVNFDVLAGQTMGIVGRNGSGKSTLLQIICSVLQPTTGEVTAKGRISALLELGAGFNAEFTGRQNVFMKGMLMGFSTEEMKKRLPEIEAFADIGEFIDQPIKIYSSGMSVRLAFACTINVDPDILIIDEALAVGDAKFQHKCFGKFLEFQKAGKTILFVSHNTEAVVRHCDSAILLENGRMLKMGEPKTIANYYTDLLFTGRYNDTVVETRKTPSPAKQDHLHDKEIHEEMDKFLNETSTMDNCVNRKGYNKNEYRYGDGRARIVDYLIMEGDRCDPASIDTGAMIDLYVKIKYNEKIKFPMTGFAIKTVDGLLVYGTNTKFNKVVVPPIEKGSLVVFKWCFKLNLCPGDYFIDLGCAEFSESVSNPLDRRYGICHISMESQGQYSGLVALETTFKEVSRDKIQHQEI